MNENDVMQILSKVIDKEIDAETVDHICNSLARMFERVSNVTNKSDKR